MMWTSIGLMVAAMLAGADPTPSASSEAFQGWFSSAVAGSLKVPPGVSHEARSFRYVFVEGLRNERMPGYFAANIAELKALGIPRSQIHVIEPDSRRTTPANAEEVRARFLEIAREGPERLVVIAHSRGACDALAFALGDPAFVRDRVRALFLIQGPFGGSGLAGYMTGSGQAMDNQMKLKHRIVASLIARMARALTKDESLEVLEGMTPQASAAYWAKALDKDKATLAEVGSRAFFIRAAIHPSKQRFPRRAMAWYLQTYLGPNDGMVALEDQSLPGFGTVLATVEAGHSDLTCNSPTSRARKGDRRALTRSIVMAVGQASSGLEPSSIKIRENDHRRRGRRASSVGVDAAGK